MNCFGKNILGTNFLPTASGDDVVLLGDLAAAPAAAGLSLGKAYFYFNTTDRTLYSSVDAGLTWVALFAGPQDWQTKTLAGGDIGFFTIAGGPLAGTFNSGEFSWLEWHNMLLWHLKMQVTITTGANGSISVNDGLTLKAGVASGDFNTGVAIATVPAGSLEMMPMQRNDAANDWFITNASYVNGIYVIHANGVMYNAST